MDTLEKYSLTWLKEAAINIATYCTILVPLIIVKHVLRHKNYQPGRSNCFYQIIDFLFYGNKTDIQAVKPDRKPVTSVKTQVLKRGFWLAVCTAGLWGTLISAGMCQEKIFKFPYLLNETGSSNITEEYYKDSQFVVFFNRLFSTVLAGFILLFQGNFKSKAGFVEYGFCSLSNILSAWFQYEALKLVNFTTVVLFKGSRILPVMIMSTILTKIRHGVFDWVTAVLLCAGSVMFMLAKDVAVDGAGLSTTTSGVVCLVLYVGFDAFTSNWQQRLYKYDITVIEMSFGVCFFSTLFTLTSILQQSSLDYTWDFAQAHPDFRTDIFLLAFASAFSQIFIALTIKKFGAVIFIIIMTTRSIPQVIVSWLYFGHHFGILGWFGVLIVFVVIVAKMMNTIRKLHEKHRKEAVMKKENRLLSNNRLESAVTIEENISSSSDSGSEISGLQMK